MSTSDSLDSDTCSFRIMYSYDSSENEINDIIYNDDQFILQIILQGCNSNNNYNPLKRKLVDRVDRIDR